MAGRLRIPRFNSPAEFQAWWSGAEVKDFLKRHPDKLSALSEHPWVKPYLDEGKTPPVPDKNQDKSTRQFGKYQIEKKLGQGGMGAVYLAYDPSLERQVALKVMILKEEDAVQRFMIEAKASARLKHSNILPVYEIGTVGKYHYFTMEYIDGVPLSDLIQDKSKRLNVRQIATVIKDISSALSYAHSQGVLHRDIKPANIMIDKKGIPYLTDFGLAKEMSKIDRSLTISGTIVGTPDYMSPEQARGLKDKMMQTSDIFSLGATLYHCLTGHLPFSGNELYQVLDQIVRKEPLPPSRLIRNLDKDIETICLKCMEKEPDKRYRTAQELQDELTRYLQGESIQAKPISILAKVLRKSKQNKIASVALIAVAVIITGMLGYLSVAKAATDRQIKEYHKQVQEELKSGEYDNAMVKLRTILNLDPANRLANDLLKETIVKKSREDEHKSKIQAEAELMATAKTRRKEAEVILAQAKAAGAPDDKIRIAQEALKKDPSYEDAYKLTGDAYREMKNYDKALEFYLKTSLPDKAKELGRKLARVNIKDPTGNPGELLEMTRLMSDLGILIFSKDLAPPCLLGRPDLRLFSTNIMIGMFDELGEPMAPEQASRYKAQVDSMFEIIGRFVRDDRNQIEQIIAILQNQDTIYSEQRKLADIMTGPQKAAYQRKTGEEFTGELSIPFVPSASYQGYNFKERDQAINFIIEEWMSVLESKPSELKAVVRPVSEKYINDYIALRKTKESVYDKDIMDNYLERNKPDETNRVEWMEYLKNRYGFRKRPDYIKTERMLNLEFLRLLDKYHKEAAKLISQADGGRLINSAPKIDHFPNLD